TRSFVEQVRGIDSSYIVAGLVDKGLICERGQLDAPGRPVLFGTTDAFLRCFGLNSIEDLPEAELPNPEQMTLKETAAEEAPKTEESTV
ncbi:MAG: SMC-Scp complex subunit ScpB, partial [Ruminococcaceae bacterium]|nr:SMC-Scp complex subunit ScpB [Oscillospiraceae bacterium]